MPHKFRCDIKHSMPEPVCFHGLLSSGDPRHALLPAGDSSVVVGHVHQMPVRHACPSQLHAGPAHRMGTAPGWRYEANGSRARNEIGTLSIYSFCRSAILIGMFFRLSGSNYSQMKSPARATPTTRSSSIRAGIDSSRRSRRRDSSR